MCFEDDQENTVSSVVDIQCGQDKVIKIEEAGYGRSQWGLCKDLIKVCNPFVNPTESDMRLILLANVSYLTRRYEHGILLESSIG